MIKYPTGPMPQGGFGMQPMQPKPMTQPPRGGFPGQPPARGTPFTKPTGPMTQPPMGGFGGQPMQRLVERERPPVQPGSGGQSQQSSFAPREGMGQQSSPYDMMQRFQQMQQLGGLPPIGQPMDRQKQFGGGYSPEMQAYYAQDAANQAQRGQMMQGRGGGMGGQPGALQQQNAAQTLALNNQLQAMGKPAMLGASPDQMQQQVQQYQQQMGQPLNLHMAQQGGQPMSQMQQPMGQPMTPPPPPPMRMNMGGAVGMPPPNPYEQQVGQEDPRMQAMRYMQQMNLGG